MKITPTALTIERVSHRQAPRQNRGGTPVLARWMLIQGALASALVLAAPAPTTAETDFRPGEVWLDTGGQAINAHGGGMLFREGTYYWYGENNPVVDWMPEWNLSVFTRGTVPSEPIGSVKKKGVGFWNCNGRANALSEKVDVLGCGWYYNWSARPDPNAKMIHAEFIPMIWSAKEATETNLSRLMESGKRQCDASGIQ